MDVLSIVLALASAGLLTNPAFEQGMEGWTTNHAEVLFDVAATEHGPAARMVVPDSVPVSYPMFAQDFAVTPGTGYDLHVEVDADTHDGHGAYVSISWQGEDGARISFDQSSPAHPGAGWQTLRVRAVAPSGAVQGRASLILKGHGEARFRDVRLATIPGFEKKPIEGPVMLTITDEVVCDNFLGFGFEDDGWLYNDQNRSRGVDEAAYRLREERVHDLQPDHVRMFLWYKDWNPSGDLKTFTWDSDNMRSKYRSLDVYQEVGAAVNVCGVEWGVKEPFAEKQALAQAWGAMMHHLVVERGYTCVRQWTLTNEPNTHFHQHGTFADYAEIHQLVKTEFARRGLAVALVGSDDTNGGLGWYQQCLEDESYFDMVDLFASHRYLKHEARELATFFYEDHLQPLAGRKPWIVAEFGFHDHRTKGPLYNPVMEDEAYARWTAAFVIEGLSLGAAGFSIWCLHEVYYPGNGFMNYGLWDFADNDWKTRPVYDTWRTFSRNARAGDSVYKVASSHPRQVRAVRVGEAVFVVNDTEAEVTVGLGGTERELAAGELRLMGLD